MISLDFSDEQGVAIAVAAAAFGVTFREMAEHAVWFKVEARRAFKALPTGEQP